MLHFDNTYCFEVYHLGSNQVDPSTAGVLATSEKKKIITTHDKIPYDDIT